MALTPRQEKAFTKEQDTTYILMSVSCILFFLFFKYTSLEKIFPKREMNGFRRSVKPGRYVGNMLTLSGPLSIQ